MSVGEVLALWLFFRPGRFSPPAFVIEADIGIGRDPTKPVTSVEIVDALLRIEANNIESPRILPCKAQTLEQLASIPQKHFPTYK